MAHGSNITGGQFGTFEEIAKHILNDVEGGMNYELKNARVYRYATPYPNRVKNSQPVKSTEGKETEQQLNNQIRVKDEN